MDFSTRAHQLVDLEGFREAGLPIEIQPLDLTCPHDEQYVLRMAVRAHGGEIILPAELEWLRGMLEVSQKCQDQLGVDHPFVYITVRHGLVKSKTDDQWHVDGFSTKVPHLPEQNYVWTSHTGTVMRWILYETMWPATLEPVSRLNRFAI